MSSKAREQTTLQYIEEFFILNAQNNVYEADGLKAFKLNSEIVCGV